MRQIGQGANIANLGQRIGWRLGKQQLGVRLQGGTPLGQVRLRNKCRDHTEFGKLLAEQVQCRAEYRTRAHHMVASLEQAHAHHEGGAHAGRRADGGLSAFERSQTPLETRHGRIGGARIGEAFLGAGETAHGGFGVGLHETAGQKQRLRVFAVLAGLECDAHSERVAMQAGGQGSVGHGVLVRRELKDQTEGFGSARRELSSSVSSTRGRPPLMRLMASVSMSPVT